MRIPNANIPAQAAGLSSSLPAATAKAPGRAQILEPTNSYNRQGRQTAAQVIDAEYVEFYSPSSKVYAKERQDLDLSLAAAPDQKQPASRTKGSSRTPGLSSYTKLSAEPSPPPGSYINVFA